MLKKLSLVLVLAIITLGSAYAGVDVNKTDQSALDGIRGIGPKTSKAILEARKNGGEFKSWADFEERVKGVGGKNAVKLAAAGLTVNGQSKSDVPVSAPMTGTGKKDKALARRGASQPASATASATK